jgi:hypothetical protein
LNDKLMTEQPEKVDLHNYAEHSRWKEPPSVNFDKYASLSIARWVFWILCGIYVLSFTVIGIMLFRPDATFEKAADLVKFMIQSMLPLVTLAVGYYLGDRGQRAE